MAEVPAPKAKPTISEIDLKSYKPNEAGMIMIPMYHRIDPKEPNNELNRQPETFRADLERLYKEGYWPVTVSELVDNKMDVPAGKTPIALTFDDGLLTQFNIVTGMDGQPHIDPNCAVGIMETFAKAHPGWPTKATFFLMPPGGRNPQPFVQPDHAADKLDYLLKHGYELANHSTTHSDMRRMSAEKIQWELANAVKGIREIAPQAQMRVFALPMGRVPGKENLKLLVSGKDGSTHYENVAFLRASWRPMFSPNTKPDWKMCQGGTLCIWSPREWGLERLTPDPRPGKGQTFEYWLNYFKEHATLRYVSDGNMDVVAVPKSNMSMVNQAAVEKMGKYVQAYNLGGTGGGGGLSVESASSPASGTSSGSDLSVQVTR
jgi:peptidoglycan/xylan/chitin deacetylase (PgdA/CDA1 family)